MPSTFIILTFRLFSWLQFFTINCEADNFEVIVGLCPGYDFFFCYFSHCSFSCLEVFLSFFVSTFFPGSFLFAFFSTWFQIYLPLLNCNFDPFFWEVASSCKNSVIIYNFSWWKFNDLCYCQSYISKSNSETTINNSTEQKLTTYWKYTEIIPNFW